MANILKIEGRKSPIINTQLNLEVGIFLSASYQGEKYNLRNILGANLDGKVILAVLKFDPEDRRDTPNGLNHIVLATTFGGIYRATGISHISKVNAAGTKFYRMGDDLEILVDPAAKEAIESIKDYASEIEEVAAGKDVPIDYFGLPKNLN